MQGGERVEPTLVDRVQDRWGGTVFKSDDRACTSCQADEWMGNPPPRLPDERERVISSGTAYQMVSMLEGVVQRGTGVRVKTVGKPLAGKTGTTNEAKDAWFGGFSGNYVAGVWMGYDDNTPLKGVTGGGLPAEIWREAMAPLLAQTGSVDLRRCSRPGNRIP